jgi:hypothetical protein
MFDQKSRRMSEERLKGGNSPEPGKSLNMLSNLQQQAKSGAKQGGSVYESEACRSRNAARPAAPTAARPRSRHAVKRL